MRSPVTGLVEQFNALTEVEQKVFLDLVDPQPEPTAKQTRKKRGKSAKAVSPSNVIAKTPKADAIDDMFMEIGLETDGPKCGTCGNAEDFQDHFQPSPHYHPFQAPAPVAAKKSSRKNAHTLSVPNTGDGSANALIADQSGD